MINQRAGAGRARRWAHELGQHEHPELEVLASETPQDVVDLIRQRRSEPPDTVAVVGGDGTISATLSACHQVLGPSLPHLAVLRGGTMNTIANGLGVPRLTPHQLLQRLLETGAATPEGPRRALILVEGRAGLLFGTGVIAGFLDAYNRQPRPGILAAVRLLGRASLGAVGAGRAAQDIVKPVHAQLHIDGQTLPHRTYQTITAGTVAQMGLGFRPFHLADQCDGAFHCIAFQGSVRQLALQLPAFALGRKLPAKLGQDRLVRALTIDAPDDQLIYSLDGDLHHGKGPLEVTVGPSLRFWT